MTTIALSFQAHRFHATPWGRHVNEGVAEWPPSPYRLLRALYDTWKRKHPELPELEVASVLGALAGEAPRFALPPGTASHTRSYLNSNTEDPNDKSLIFDAFVAVNPGAECYITWPNTGLSAPQSATLNRLLSSLNYVGRSESWVDAKLCDGPTEGTVRCEPLSEMGPSGEVIAVACAIPPADYGEKKPWLHALASSTAEYQKERRSSPAAMRMVPYSRPAEALVTRVVRRPAVPLTGPQAVILGLDGPVLPLFTAAIEIAEQVRMRLMGIHKRLMGGDPRKVSMKFSGKDRAGSPLVDHSHAFILPLGDGQRIRQVLIYTRDVRGFDATEVQAILNLNELYGHAQDHPIRTLATWRGKLDDPTCFHSGTHVVSTTPYVPALHWRKGRGTWQEFVEDEIRRECRNHQMLEPVRVVPSNSPGMFEWVEFRRNRKGEDPRKACWLKLEFAGTVRAPFSLGYACHFGLGQFGPVE